MNGLSWAILLSDLCEKVGAGATIALVLSLSGACVALLFAMDLDGDELDTARTWRRLFVVIAAICVPLVVLVPSQKTILLIVASQYGEQALKSNTGGKVAEALNMWLDKQGGDNK